MQNNTSKIWTRKIVFVKVESSVNINIWKRSLIQTLRRYWFYKRLEEILLGSQGTVNQTTYFPKNSATHWRGTVVLESK